MTEKKLQAKIIMDWDGDTYFWTLVVDGKVVLNAYSKEECTSEAEKLGADLQETYTA